MEKDITELLADRGDKLSLEARDTILAVRQINVNQLAMLRVLEQEVSHLIAAQDDIQFTSDMDDTEEGS